MIHAPRNSPPRSVQFSGFYVCAASGATFPTVQLLSTSTAPGRGPRGWGGPSLPPLPARPPPLRCPSLHACCPGCFVLTWPSGLPASPEFPKIFQELLRCPSLQDWGLPPAHLSPGWSGSLQPLGARLGLSCSCASPGRAADPCGGALLVGDPRGLPEGPQPQSSSPLLPPASPGLLRPEGWGRADRFPLGRPGPMSLPSRAVFTGWPSPALLWQDTLWGLEPGRRRAHVGPGRAVQPRACPRGGPGPVWRGPGAGLRLTVGVRQAVGSCGSPRLLCSSEHPPSPVLE